MSARPFVLGERRIGPGTPVFIVAEAGVNHNGDPALAHRLVDAAAEVGADAVKFQTFRVDSLVSRDAPKAGYQVETTGGRESQRDMLARLELGVEVLAALRDRATKRGLVFFSTPFDEGSADVLEALGVRLDLTPESAGRSLDVLGITFLFAPNYHTAMRNAAPARREVGVRTVFNLLGPVTNPAGATRQLLGVYDDRHVVTLAEVLRLLGSERAMVVHGADGMDELTIFGPNHVAELRDGAIREFTLDPAEVGLAHTDRAAVAGGSPQENAKRTRAILAGETGPARDIVVLNAAAALVVAGVSPEIRAGIERAKRALDSGDAARKLAELAAFRG